jgi:hypothetical protein
MRGCITQVVLNPVVLLAIAFLLALVGGSLAFDVPTSLARARQVEQMPVLDAVTSGQPTWIEGQVDDQTPAVLRDFVAYVREQYRSCGRSSCWIEVARETPRLVVERVEDTVLIANADYAFDSTAVTVEEAPPSTFRGSVQLRGFVVGSPIFAVGRRAEDREMPAIDADFVYAGTRREYIADLRRYARRAVPWSAACLLAAVLCGGVSAWQIRAFLREARQNPPPTPVVEQPRRGKRKGAGSRRRGS